MAENTVSVVITAYNIKDLAADTVHAVCSQTLRDLEIIIVDDGSTDGTGEVLDRLAAEDPRIRVLHKENGGASSARLAGVSAARGEWITILDGDDIPENTLYEKLLLNALTYSADVSQVSCRMVYPDRTEDFYGTGKLLVQSAPEALRDLVSGEFIEPQLGAKLFRRDLFEGLADEYDTSIRYLEDLLMGFYLIRKASISVYEDVCLLNYMRREGSLSSSGINPKLVADPLTVTRTILRETERMGMDNVQTAAREKYLRRLIYNVTGYTGKDRKTARPFERSALKELRSVKKQALSWNVSARIRIMTVWCSFWPASYRFVHSAYARIKKLDRRYRV